MNRSHLTRSPSMRSSIFRLAPAVFGALGLSAVNAASQPLPDGWTAIADSGPSESVQFVAMAPGWHVNPGPAALVYEPARVLSGSFRIEYDVHIFAGEPSSSGVFFGGRNLQPERYDFFEIMLDTQGRYRLGHRAGPEYHEVIPWTRHEAIRIPTADMPGFNQVGIDVSPTRLAVFVNGVEVTGFEPPAYVLFDGAAGIRVSDGADIHVVRLEFPGVGVSPPAIP